MKILILLILVCGSAFGADTIGIQVITTAKTNAETASVYTTEILKRGGQTNLVRTTKTKSGTMRIRIQKFFHQGMLIGDYVAMTNSSGFTTEAGTPYSVSFEFWASKEIRSAVIGTKDGVILDAFTCTNGLFYPADSSIIAKANGITKDLSHVLSPAHITSTPPEDFERDVERIIQKHQDPH